MKKQYIAPQMVETEITLRSCICSGGGGFTMGKSDTPTTMPTGGDAPKRLGKMYI